MNRFARHQGELPMLPILASLEWNSQTIAVIGVFSIPLAAILGGIWASMNKVRSDNELKQSMVNRGMSADEIERVMNARSKIK